MRFAICDDNKDHIAILQAFFDQRPELDIQTATYTSGEALLHDYEENQRYDALFIDMEMGGMNGIATANAIRAIDERVIIVFVTSHAQYAVESFQCEPLDFLVKPVQEDKLARTLSVIAKKLSKPRATLSFQKDGEYIRLYCDDIIYCESDHNDVCIHTSDAVYTLRTTLADIAERLPTELFFRVNRGCLVNFAYVARCTADNVILLYKSDARLLLRRQSKKPFTEALIAYEERTNHA